MMRFVAAFFALLIVILGGIWVAEGSNFFLYKWMSPREEQVRRETFEQSKAYNQGMIQEVQNMVFEYTKATPDQQPALASIILHRVADYDETKLPPDLKKFIAELKQERLNP